ncbi:MAG: hypothetical protein K5897_05205 [Eubacterium sp.]|nr:hypothetical protein [Eubacterium sp.]
MKDKKNYMNQELRQGRGTGSAVSLSSIGILLMVILPWMVYDQGAGAAWIAVGCFAGMLLLWQTDSYRLLRYSLQQKDRMTLPGFFNGRFREKKPGIRISFALVMIPVLLFVSATLLYGVSEFAEILLGVEKIYTVIGLILISVGLFFVFGRGGLCLAECWIAPLVLFAFVALNLAILRCLGSGHVLENIFHSWAAGSVSEYVNVGYMGGKHLSIMEIISLFSLGFLVPGNPLALARFQRSDRARTIHRSRRWAVIFSLLTLFLSVLTGGMLRAALYPSDIRSVKGLFLWILKEDTNRGFLFHLAGLVFVAAAALVALDLIHTCILHATEMLHEDVVPYLFPRRKSERSRERRIVTVILLSTEACVFVLAMRGGNYMYTVSADALIILGAGLAPATWISLLNSRTTAAGCIAAFFGGMGFAAFWIFVKCIPLGESYGSWMTMQELTGFAAVLPGMAFGMICGKIGTLAAKEPTKEVVADFEEVRYRLVSSDSRD